MIKISFFRTVFLTGMLGLLVGNVAVQTLTLNLQSCPKSTTSDGYWTETYKAGEKMDLSKLPVGEYRLVHGHKHIPIKKVK